MGRARSRKEGSRLLRLRSTRGGSSSRAAPSSSRDDTARSFTPRWRDILWIFALALLWRCAYLYEAGRNDAFNLFYMDEDYNLGWARCLATGEWPSPFDAIRGEVYFRAPLYSYFVAGLLALFRGDTLLVRAFQMLLGSVSCVLAYALATRCYGRVVGAVTGALCAAYWVLIYFDGEFLLPVLLVFLLISAILLLHAAITRRSAWLGGTGGLAFGLYAITRPNILLFFPVLFVWTWRIERAWPRRSAWALLAAVTAGALLPPIAVTLRNRIVGHDWVVIASQGGMNFYIGNNAESNGIQAIIPGTRSTWWGGYQDVVAIAEKAEGRSLRPSEVSDYWYRRGFAYIREHPGGWLRLLGRKMLAWIGDAEIPNNEAYSIRRREYRSLFLPLGFGVLFAGFLVSLPFQVRMARGPRAGENGAEAARRALIALVLLFLAAYTLSFLAFFVTGRYRVAIVPLVGMGAALTAVHVVDALRRRDARRGLPPIAIAALLAVLLHVDVLGVRSSAESFASYNRAVEKLDLGKLDEGIAALERLMESDTVYEPEFYGTMIRAYDRRGRPEDRSEMALVAEFALQFYPDNPDLLWSAACAHAGAGDWERAEARAERYAAAAAGDPRGWSLAFRAAMQQGRSEAAARYLSRAEEAAPGDPLVRRMRAEWDARPARSPGWTRAPGEE